MRPQCWSFYASHRRSARGTDQSRLLCRHLGGARVQPVQTGVLAKRRRTTCVQFVPCADLCGRHKKSALRPSIYDSLIPQLTVRWELHNRWANHTCPFHCLDLPPTRWARARAQSRAKRWTHYRFNKHLASPAPLTRG